MPLSSSALLLLLLWVAAALEDVQIVGGRQCDYVRGRVPGAVQNL
jgi:hypothetical protein